MVELRTDMQTQAQDLIGLASGFARTDARVFVQNTASAAVHYAKPNDAGHTICGWRYVGARRRGNGPPYCIAPNLQDMPGHMLCEKGLPTEWALALHLLEGELGLVSGDDSTVRAYFTFPRLVPRGTIPSLKHSRAAVSFGCIS